MGKIVTKMDKKEIKQLKTDVCQILRMILTGQEHGPDIFAIMDIIGKDSITYRIDRYCKLYDFSYYHIDSNFIKNYVFHGLYIIGKCSEKTKQSLLKKQEKKGRTSKKKIRIIKFLFFHQT